MNWIKPAAIILIVAGALSLAYGQFTYRHDKSSDVGPIKITVQDHDTVKIPTWASVGAIAVGSLVLLVGAGSRVRT